MQESPEKDHSLTAKDEKAREMDDFWDMTELLPPRKVSYPASRPFSVETVEITVPSAPAPEQAETKSETSSVWRSVPIPRKADDEKEGETKDVSHLDGEAKGKTARQPVDAYRPDHPLIREVRIYPWSNTFHFYERFWQTAERLFPCHGEPCEAVNFFSYMPQYDQMNRSQLSWYLYWRDGVRENIFRKTDYSYVFLLIFEIINLPDQIPPQEGQRLLCRLWLQYRASYPLLDRYLPDWICDYSLIYHLNPPTEQIGEEEVPLLMGSSLKEFFISSDASGVVENATLYLQFCSNYDYRKSKVYHSGEREAALYSRHIPGALGEVLRTLREKGKSLCQESVQTVITARDAFVGALCSYRIKRRIEVEYCSFSRSHALRFLITDIVRYAENRLRGILGLRSRLSVYGLPDSVRQILDGYFDREFPSGRLGSEKKKEDVRPAYEALYDVPSAPASFARAAEIEQASWGTTDRLLDSMKEEATADEALPVAKEEELFGRDGETRGSASSQMAREPSSEQGTIAGILKGEGTVPDPVGADCYPTSRDVSSRPDAPPSDEETIPVPFVAFLRAALAEDRAGMRKAAAEQGQSEEMLTDAVNDWAIENMGDILMEISEGEGAVLIEDYRQELSQRLDCGMPS